MIIRWLVPVYWIFPGTYNTHSINHDFFYGKAGNVRHYWQWTQLVLKLLAVTSHVWALVGDALVASQNGDNYPPLAAMPGVELCFKNAWSPIPLHEEWKLEILLYYVQILKPGIHRTWWIWSVCKCVRLILWGFRHFFICFCYDWIAKGDGRMGAPSCRMSYIYIYIYMYTRVCMYMCVWRCVYVQTRACTCMRASIYKWVLFCFVFVVRLVSQLERVV